MSITQMERRRIEAEQALRMYEALTDEFGKNKALEIIGRVSAAAAFEHGRELAAKAPEGEPSLKHFATIMDVWRAGEALDFKDERLSGDEWSFVVTRCGYVDLYREMGLPGELAYKISCIRDEHLARGYSQRLRLERPGVVALGASSCSFRFIWT
jgi:hypothetical protein